MSTEAQVSTLERLNRIEREIRGVKSLYGITSWEVEFMARLRTWRGELTAKQEETLRQIEKKVFGIEEEDS